MEPKYLSEEVTIHPNHHLRRWLDPQGYHIFGIQRWEVLAIFFGPKDPPMKFSEWHIDSLGVGQAVWIPKKIPENERDCYEKGTRFESQNTTKIPNHPNHQLTITLR